MTVKIFKAGNSDAVVIPRPLVEELRLQTGQEVVVERVPDSEAIVIAPVKKKTSKTGVSLEFKRWLANFLKEDAEILDELAGR